MTASTPTPHRATGHTPLETIARDVLRLGPGARLPTTLHYQEVLEVGSGTVQKALRQLQNEGAVSLVARGHMGTFVTALDTALLWSAARLSPVHLLLPPNAPPESLRVATAVAERFAPVGAFTTVGHLRGARDRLRALDAERADIAVMSSGAARDLVGPTDGASHGREAPAEAEGGTQTTKAQAGDGPQHEAGSGSQVREGLGVGGSQGAEALGGDGSRALEAVGGGTSQALEALGEDGHRTLTLGPGTYYAPGSLVVVTRATASDETASSRAAAGELRVGIDPRSDDHRRLTRAEFAAGGARYVETDFTLVPRAVLLGEIDAGVWHTVDSLIPLEAAGLAVTPLTTPAAGALADRISSAVLVATADNIPGVVLARSLADDPALTPSAFREQHGPPQLADPLRLRLERGAAD